MNKMIKGSVAGATGVALLMGGFGTYALWSDTENLAASSVKSGELSIDTTAGVWDDANTKSAANDWLATDKMVPGDEVTYTQTFTVKGSGKNLAGTIELDALAMSPNTFSNQLTRTVDVVASGAGATSITKYNATEFTFASPFGTATLTAKVTYTFPDTVTGLNNQDKAATTPASTFTIQQS